MLVQVAILVGPRENVENVQENFGFYPQKRALSTSSGMFFFQGQAATYLLNKGIVRKVRSLSLQLVGRKLRVLAVRKTPSFEGQFRNSKF